LADRSPEEMIRSLEAIDQSDSNYDAARYDLTLAWHRKWTAARTRAERQQAAEELTKAAQSYLATNPEDASRQVKCCLLMAKVALQGDPPERRAAEQALGRAERQVNSLPEGSPTVAEYHYRQLQLATAKGDPDARRQHAEWLATYGSGTPYEIPALTVVASGLDRQARAAAEQGRPGPVADARDAFERLSRKLGTSGAAIRANKNAQVATSRLAHYASEAGDFQQAAESLDQLLAVFPKDRRYLRRAGMADFQAGNFDRSLQRWRTLLAGLPKDADSWFEAKYYQIRCLQQTSPAQAQKVLRQFQLLHPQLGPPAWRDKFEQLVQ
jgi:tetratricopeptide (TPR) repeat protein